MNVNANGLKILLIEDEPLICRVCERTLAADGFEVDVAGNGLIASEMADRKVYDLFISDIRTPAMNGIEFYEQLERKAPELAKRVIFSTGDVLSPEIKVFLNGNHAPFLAKPFTPTDLRTIVRKALGDRLVACS